MPILKITPEQREEWNAFVAKEPSFALFQSWEWGEFKEKMAWKVYRVAIKDKGQIIAGAQILIKPLPLGLASVAYIPRGPIGSWLDEGIVSQMLNELHRVSRKHRAIFLKIEPPLLYNPGICQRLLQHDFKSSSYTNQPRATLVVDLSQDLEDILEQLPRKTRYDIKYAVRKGISVQVGRQEDLLAFYDLMKTTCQRDGFSLRSRDYFEHEWQAFAKNEQAILLKAYYQGQLLATRLAFCFGKNAADLHAASSNEFRNLRPNYLLVWEAIKWAKARGCDTYDLWGIPDEVGQAAYEQRELPTTDRLEGLWGVYQFKRRFSKNVVFYVNAYDYVYSKPLYALITSKFFKGDLFDKISAWMNSKRQYFVF